ncbi:response regulator transcription factor [Leifsonia sp. 2TAF2]|uniref:helix-turn-helix transcriptional regulator n=1 Tax=Leifsonia sp. 2TAF2 TaxID=3233009 RepID=UPI003F9A14EA
MTSDEQSGDANPATVDPRVRPFDLPVLVADTAARDGWEAANSVIESHWDAFASVAPKYLLAALKALPGEAFVNMPSLSVAANYLQHVVIDGEPRRFFHDGRLTPNPDPEASANLDTLILLTGKAAGDRTAGRLEEARRTALEAKAVLGKISSADRGEFVGSLPHLRFQWGRTLDAAQASGALAEYEEAYDLARLTRQPVIARRAAGHIAWMHADRGRLNDADLWLARAQAEPATNGRYDVILFLTSALLKQDRQDPTAHVDLGRALGLPLGEQWAAALWVSALLAHGKPGASSVDARLERELERHPEVHLGGADARYVKAARARLARARPRLRDEIALIPTGTALDPLLEASHAYFEGRFTDALASSEEARKLTAAPRVEAPALLVASASHHELGHFPTAADSFRAANVIIQQERIFSAYTFVPARTLATIAEQAGEPIHGKPLTVGEDIAVPKLTNRERTVLELLSSGLSIQQIAAELYISPNTLKSAMQDLYRKLGVNSRAAAVHWAKQSDISFRTKN